LEDFAQLELPEDDVKDLRRCKPGDCDVKLSAKGLQILRTQVHWRTPTEKSDADAAFRRILFEYVNGYREGGNARLAVYRDSDAPVFVANEFRSMIEGAPSLARMPDLQKYLLEYPSAPLPALDGFPLLAEGAVRAETNDPDQSLGHSGSSRANGHCVKDAIRLALFLDGSGAASAAGRSRTWPGILVRDGESQSIGWPQRIHRPAHSRSRPFRGAERNRSGPEVDEG
jgi:hypothetical protein